jgi:hypothetical protein
MHIPFISDTFRWYIAYAMYMICILLVYTDDIPKLMQWAVAAVQTDDGRHGWAG